MPKRRFTDVRGVKWEVWDVRTSDIPTDRGHDPVDIEHSRVALELANGWLCFQSGEDRRRFAPVPPAWDELPDGVLRVMLEVSDRVHHHDVSGEQPFGGSV
jgi:hypothetical protein